MRKLLPALVAIATIYTAPAKAQFFIPGTGDLLTGPGTPVFDVTSVAHLIEQVGISQDQLTELVTLYKETVQVYTMATNIWNSVNELVGADGWAAALNDLRTGLPYAAADHPGWVGGFNDPAGLPFGTQFLGQNTVGGDLGAFDAGEFPGAELIKAIRSFSSMQATATNHLATIEERIDGLADLFGHLAAIGTVQEADSLSARLHNELNFATGQQVQAQQVMSAAQLQVAVLDNNQKQWSYLDETNGIHNACGQAAAAAAFMTIPACH